ncbi:hypothetical protein GCM10011512_10520 [Tersicoccus solisilvae]|uniref:SAF domain-containing protein n=1 Tax=Tersicoccus solisilvae TaxID=1882339 RepID=A0ABQ1NVH7_9MICC|nr:Flp pilus assembly protein CpaB [Tersicoccus solisilvae]GGC85566.1 hypothetical protein GCM10011512_10520 [Tersicoccus solisilvae]
MSRTRASGRFPDDSPDDRAPRAGRLPLRRVEPDRSLPRRLVRLVRRRRRLVVALLLCAAAGVLVDGLTPASAVTLPVVVAAHDLPAGAVLTGGDLERTDWPPGAVPDGAVTSVAAVTGGRLGAPLRRGSPVTDAALLGPGLLTGAPPGRSAVPLRVADPTMLRVLRPGDLVDVVAVGREDPGAGSAPARDPARLIARSVTVLWTSAEAGGSAAAGGVWPAAQEDTPLAVVAVPRTVAAALAAATGGTGTVALVIVEPDR